MMAVEEKKTEAEAESRKETPRSRNGRDHGILEEETQD
jgi:hypothetical protein